MFLIFGKRIPLLRFALISIVVVQFGDDIDDDIESSNRRQGGITSPIIWKIVFTIYIRANYASELDCHVVQRRRHCASPHTVRQATAPGYVDLDLVKPVSIRLLVQTGWKGTLTYRMRVRVTEKSCKDGIDRPPTCV